MAVVLVAAAAIVGYREDKDIEPKVGLQCTEGCS